MVSVHESLLGELELSEQEFFSKVSHFMNLFVSHDMMSLESFLLPETSHDVTSYYGSLPHAAKSPSVEPSFGMACPGIKELTERQCRLLHEAAPNTPQESPQIVDLSQSSSRTRSAAPAGGELVVPCITPRGLFYHTGRMRKLLGLECLRLQGIWYDDLKGFPQVLATDNRALQDLAGNAFHGCCCGALLLATLMAISMYRARLDANVHCTQADSAGDCCWPNNPFLDALRDDSAEEQ